MSILVYTRLENTISLSHDYYQAIIRYKSLSCKIEIDQTCALFVSRSVINASPGLCCCCPLCVAPIFATLQSSSPRLNSNLEANTDGCLQKPSMYPNTLCGKIAVSTQIDQAHALYKTRNVKDFICVK